MVTNLRPAASTAKLKPHISGEESEKITTGFEMLELPIYIINPVDKTKLSRISVVISSLLITEGLFSAPGFSEKSFYLRFKCVQVLYS